MRSSLLVLLSGLILAAGVSASADDDKVPPVKKIMQSQHGKDGSLPKLEKGLKGTPDWEELQKLSKEYAKQIGYMTKNESPDASKKDLWKKLTDKIAKSGKDLDDGVKKKDDKEALKVIKDIRGQCMGCHSEFR